MYGDGGESIGQLPSSTACFPVLTLYFIWLEIEASEPGSDFNTGIYLMQGWLCSVTLQQLFRVDLYLEKTFGQPPES